ncbi:hypothetical protein DXG01_008799 [Tephrocybe rancida]|nr:hypothetical protein DXG01_008799 [Tephrocybe rancida]
MDFKVLDFVLTLFLHVTPNNTGWTDTVETFLTKQGYKLAYELLIIRVHYENGLATHWCGTMFFKTPPPVILTKYFVLPDVMPSRSTMGWSYHTTLHPSLSDKDTPPQSLLLAQSPPTPSQPPHTPLQYPTVKDEDKHDEEDSPIVVAGFKRGRNEDNVEELPNPFPDPLARIRPSDYLRARCPLCFGGEFPWARTEDERPDDDPDAIVCIDACFTQKRNRQARDPPRTHPRTVFIPEADAEAMEKHVEFIRSKRACSIKKPNTEEPDHFEGSLRVPKSVLDG